MKHSGLDGAVMTAFISRPDTKAMKVRTALAAKPLNIDLFVQDSKD